MQRLSYPSNRFCVKELCKHMKIETSGMENKMIMLYWLRCSWRLKTYKNSEAKETDFPRIYTTWLVGGEWFSERNRIFEKNIPGNGEMITPLFDGLSYNTRRRPCSLLLASLLDSKTIISDKQLFCFF